MDAELFLILWATGEGIVKALAVWLVCLLSRKLWDKAMSERCLIKTCARQAAKRGLCLVCYSRAKAKVESSQTTWPALEAAGLCLEENSPFEQAFGQAFPKEHKEDES